MAADPVNPKTWGEVQENVHQLREVVDQFEAPPAPDDEYGSAMFELKRQTERLERIVETHVRVEEGEDI